MKNENVPLNLNSEALCPPPPSLSRNGPFFLLNSKPQFEYWMDAIGPETDFRIENTENQTMIRIKFRILLSRIEGGIANSSKRSYINYVIPDTGEEGPSK